jgi:hypothetical protein
MKKTLLFTKTLLIFIGLTFSGSLFAQDIVITEIMYNPPESGADSLEFVELYNNTASTIDLTNYTLVGGTFTFPSGASVSSGAYVVVAVDSMAMVNAFGFIGAYEYTNALSNSGELVEIKNNLGVTIDAVTYDDNAPFPTGGALGEPEGGGASISLCDITSDNNLGANWSISVSSTGVLINGKMVLASPGVADNCTTGCGADSENPVAICKDTTVYLNASGLVVVDPNIINNGSTDNCDTDLSFMLSLQTFTCSEIGDNQSTLTATDNNNNTNTCMSTITVLDTLKPLVDEVSLADSTANCKVESLEIPSAADNCSGIVTVTNDATFPITENTTVTWSYEDESGNIEIQTQNVIINQANISLSAVLTDEIIPNSGAIDLTVSGNGSSPYSFDWSNNETTEDLTGLSGGDYTIVVSDDNGCSTDSTFTVDSQLGIQLKETFLFSIYPNPAITQLTINSSQIGATVGVYGIDGKLVMNEFTINSNKQTFKLNDLKTGIYFVKLSTYNSERTVRLIVK